MNLFVFYCKCWFLNGESFFKECYDVKNWLIVCCYIMMYLLYLGGGKSGVCWGFGLGCGILEKVFKNVGGFNEIEI